MLTYSSFVKVLDISINPMYYTVTQAYPLAKTMYKQQLDQVTVVLADFTSTKLDKCRNKLQFTVLGIFCSK